MLYLVRNTLLKEGHGFGIQRDYLMRKRSLQYLETFSNCSRVDITLSRINFNLETG